MLRRAFHQANQDCVHPLQGAAGMAFVMFDKVRISLSNTVDKEGKGMSVILSNFNHARDNSTVLHRHWTDTTPPNRLVPQILTFSSSSRCAAKDINEGRVPAGFGYKRTRMQVSLIVECT